MRASLTVITEELQRLIDDGVIPGNAGLVIQLAVLVALMFVRPPLPAG